MKLIFVLVALAAVFLSSGVASGRSDSRDWSLKDMNGETFALSEHVGQPILLLFWATWCIPCKKELTEREGLFNGYVERGVLVILVSEDTPRSQARVKPYIESKGYKWPVLLDPNGELLKRYGGTSSIPYTVLLDKKGERIYKLLGAIKNDKLLSNKVNAALGVSGE